MEIESAIEKVKGAYEEKLSQLKAEHNLALQQRKNKLVCFSEFSQWWTKICRI